MARNADEGELARIAAEVSVQRLAEGTELAGSAWSRVCSGSLSM